MRFYNMNGYDIIRIREVLGKSPDQVPDDVASVLSEHGYIKIDDMFVKGNLTSVHYPWEDILSYVLWKQRVAVKRRYPNVMEAARALGGLRSDSAAAIRCNVKVPLKKMFEMGFLVKLQAIPDYVTYCTMDFAKLCRRAKDRKMTENMVAIMGMVRKNKPLSRKQLFDTSPIGHRDTYEALKELNNGSIIYTDQNKRIKEVPDLDMAVEEARKEAVRLIFRSYGIFSAENLSSYMKYELPMRELRSILAELEREEFLVKGFLIEGDDTVHWVLKEDVERIDSVKSDTSIVLPPEDNLHTYLQSWIRQMLGGSNYSIILEGSKMIGSFRGKTKGQDIIIQEFIGEQKARDVLTRYLHESGLTMRNGGDDTVPDWEILDFYEKTHPGEV